jgi:hypothetical protein
MAACIGAGRPTLHIHPVQWISGGERRFIFNSTPELFTPTEAGKQHLPVRDRLSLLLLQKMPSLGCVQGFAPRFDLDTTEHDLRTDPSMSQQLLDYLSRGESQVSDRAPRPVIRPTAAAEPPRCVPTGPDAYFHRCVKFDFPALLI